MAYEFKFPDVGEGIAEGKLVEWTVSIGDKVKADDTVAKVETDKAVVDIPSPISGVVKNLLFKNGDMINVGNVIMHIDEDKSEQVDRFVEIKEESNEDLIQEVKEEVSGIKTSVQEVANIPARLSTENQREILAMPNVRKTAKEKKLDLNSIKGTGKHGQITVEDLIEGKEKNKLPAPTTFAENTVPEKKNECIFTPAASKDIIATPSIRRKARELCIDINKIKGTGENGRITEEDLKKDKDLLPEVPTPKHLEPKKATSNDAQINNISPKEITQEDVRIPIQGIRAIIAKRMLESQEKTATITLFEEADITELVEFRNRHKVSLKERGIKLSYLPFFMKAAITASKKYPDFNSIVDENSNEYIQKAKHNLGVAVDTKRGLIVPVVKDCDNKNIIELSQEVGILASKAREQKITPTEMSDGTFTITSLGALGGGFFTPIINYPQVAILGIGKIEEKPVIRNGEILIRSIVYLSLSCDHRIVDGANAGRFLKEIKNYLEDPELMLMEMK